jgi:hypothetical protein
MYPLEGQPGNPIQLTYTVYQRLDPSLYPQLTMTVDLTVGPCGPWWNFNDLYTGPGPTPTPPPLLANFKLSFSIPVNKGITIAPNQVVEAGGVQMRLERVTFTPSYTAVHLCYAQPERSVFFSQHHSEWGLGGVTLQVGEGQPAMQLFGLGGEQGCLDTGFAVAVGKQPGKLVVSVPELIASDNDEVALEPSFQEYAREKLSKLGIEVQFTPEDRRSWQFTHLPDGMTASQADEKLRGLMEHTISGPWVFTFTSLP